MNSVSMVRVSMVGFQTELGYIGWFHPATEVANLWDNPNMFHPKESSQL